MAPKFPKVIEKLVHCGGGPSSTPVGENDYPQNAYIPMRSGKWREIGPFGPYDGLYGCHESAHHTVYWSLEDARSGMRDGDWIIEFVPVARYRCGTGKVEP